MPGAVRVPGYRRSMHIASHNVNGIRAAHRRGFATWLSERNYDVVGLQEVRCRIADLPEGVWCDRYATYDPGELAGRNGVALLTRTPPVEVRSWSGAAVTFAPSGSATVQTLVPALARELTVFRTHGRYIEVDLAEAPLTIACVYVPKGDSPLLAPGDEKVQGRYDAKMAFLNGFAKQLDRARRDANRKGREFLVVGDFNIAHTNLDLKNWRSNQKTSGFLPEEREWLSTVINPRTLVDVTRSLHPQSDGPYSWWSWRGQAFANDTGWRIDYHLASPALAKSAVSAHVDREDSYDDRISDHAAVVVNYAI
ncbi:exodeoxyribonuclease III [Propionibacterium sp. oral taxon 192 str. F0372]|nr:exodeoxyribonuclease III [Propionibacterium sp. oral taxon 192 str. F0372]